MTKVSSETVFEADVRVLDEQRAEFAVERAGSFKYIHRAGLNKGKYSPIDFGGISGAHLARMVRRDVDLLLPEIPEGATYKTEPPNVYVNVDNVNQYAGDYAFQLDIKNCYWKTAYNLGLITKETYFKGLKKDEWKVGRNAAIGALDKKSVWDFHENGKLVETERFYMPPNCRYARSMVLQRVDEVAKKAIYEIVKDHFLFFVVDCFFIRTDAVEAVRDYLESTGYGFTSANIFLKQHNEKDKMIRWDKTEVKRSKIPGKTKLVYKEEKDKFIHYTERSKI